MVMQSMAPRLLDGVAIDVLGPRAGNIVKRLVLRLLAPRRVADVKTHGSENAWRDTCRGHYPAILTERRERVERKLIENSSLTLGYERDPLMDSELPIWGAMVSVACGRDGADERPQDRENRTIVWILESVRIFVESRVNLLDSRDNRETSPGSAFSPAAKSSPTIAQLSRNWITNIVSYVKVLPRCPRAFFPDVSHLRFPDSIVLRCGRPTVLHPCHRFRDSS